jgi:hypothetical protein
MNRIAVASELVRVAKCLIAGNPSRSEIKGLVEAYGKYLGSQKLGAPIPIQQRLYDRYLVLFNKLRVKHPDRDMISDEFQRQLETMATKWWESRISRGPGADW